MIVILRNKQDQMNDKQQQINELKDSLNTEKVASQRDINGLKTKHRQFETQMKAAQDKIKNL